MFKVERFSTLRQEIFGSSTGKWGSAGFPLSFTVYKSCSP